MKPFKLVATGGTFDIIHDGHLALLSTAFRMGENVIIGVTSDRFAISRKPKQKILHNYSYRVKNLEEMITQIYGNAKYRIKKLNDIYGPTMMSNSTEAIITSEETEVNARIINEIRGEKGLDSLWIIIVPTIKSEDGIKISSSRIRLGLIDRKGRLIREE